MPVDDPILQFIAQPENLPLALDISKKVERLKVTLHKQFWPAITAELRERLEASEYGDRWQLVGPAKGKETRDWAAASIKPFPADERVFVYATLEQRTSQSDYRVNHGIHWSQQFHDQFETNAVRALIDRLNQQGFRTNSHWPGVKPLDLWLRRQKFLLRMANDEETFIKETADILWNLFVEYESLLTAANKELARLK
jgi:hypothetical protein